LTKATWQTSFGLTHRPFLRKIFERTPISSKLFDSWLDDPFPDYDTEPVMSFSAT
jgi:hypothetical protein